MNQIGLKKNLTLISFVSLIAMNSMAQVEDSNEIEITNGNLTIIAIFEDPLMMQDGSTLSWTQELRQPYVDAVNRWLEVINGVKGKAEHVMEIIFFVETFDDGLGAAGPFFDEIENVNGHYIPIGGEVLISNFTYSEDFASEFDSPEERDAEFNANILHELGHVFGIGTLWNLGGENNAINEDSETFNIREWAIDRDTYKGPIYQQPNGVREYNRIFGTSFDFVPLIIETKDHLFAITADDPPRILDDGTGIPDMTPALMANGQVLTTVTVGMLDDIGWEVDYSKADVYPGQELSPTNTPLPHPTPTVTSFPVIPTNTPVTVVPTPTELPDGGEDLGDGGEVENEPVLFVEFDQASLAENGWLEISGGFTGSIPGKIDYMVELTEQFESSEDGMGVSITVDPGEVTFIYSQTLIESKAPVLMRVSIRSTNSTANVALAALRGNLVTGELLDGSIGFINPAGSSAYVDEEGALVLIYQPDEGEWITPAFQVSSSNSNSGQVTVFLDRFEAYIINEDFNFDLDLFSNK